MESPGPELRDGSDGPTAVRVVGNTATPNRARRVAVLGGFAALASAVVAASSSGLPSRLPGELPPISTGEALGAVVAVLLAAMLLGFVGLAYLTWLERLPRRRGPEPAVLEEEPQRTTDWSALLLPILFVSVIALGIALVWLFGQQGRETTVQRPPLPPAQPPASSSGGEAGGWTVHWLVFAVLSSVGLVAATVLLVRDWRRRRSATTLTPAEELISAVDESLDDLEREPDPRLAVIKAYARMERAFAAQEAERRPQETPREYLARTLGDLPISHASISRLTSLFQWAKFSDHAIDRAMKQDAIAALSTLRAELAQSPLAGRTQ